MIAVILTLNVEKFLKFLEHFFQFLLFMSTAEQLKFQNLKEVTSKRLNNTVSVQEAAIGSKY